MSSRKAQGEYDEKKEKIKINNVSKKAIVVDSFFVFIKSLKKFLEMIISNKFYLKFMCNIKNKDLCT